MWRSEQAIHKAVAYFRRSARARYQGSIRYFASPSSPANPTAAVTIAGIDWTQSGICVPPYSTAFGCEIPTHCDLWNLGINFRNDPLGSAIAGGIIAADRVFGLASGDKT